MQILDAAKGEVLTFCSKLDCSYREEANADRAIKALTSALAPKAKVIRDGKTVAFDATGLVPGTPPPPRETRRGVARNIASHHKQLGIVLPRVLQHPPTLSTLHCSRASH